MTYNVLMGTLNPTHSLLGDLWGNLPDLQLLQKSDLWNGNRK